MALREIVKYPDDALRRKAEPLAAVDDSVRRLMDDMVETMYASRGLGLAAPQVGVSSRVIVVHVPLPGDEEGEMLPLLRIANPEITSAEGEVEYEEGCLSLPGFLTPVERAASITLKGLNYEGREFTMRAEGLLAIALQHEIDHLEGALIIDKAPVLKREFYKKRVKKSLASAG